MIPGLSKWQSVAVALVAGVLLVIGTWLHGRHAGIESARKEALTAEVKALDKAMERQAEVAKTIGDAMRMSHEREAEIRKSLADSEKRRRAAETWRREQVDSSPDCAAWAAAPVACRLRPEDQGGGG